MTAEFCPTSESHKAQQVSGGNAGKRLSFALRWTSDLDRATF